MRYEKDMDSAGTESGPSMGSESSMGRRVRAHARRGHWHHYWTGLKADERKLVLKWTAPTIIHPEDGLDDVITVVPVKK